MSEEAFEEIEIEDDLEDLAPVPSWSEGAVLWSTDWTSETLISQLNKKNIDLEPIFQRRSAWTPKRESLFIESLILGLPIPQIILADDKNQKGSFIVIDGKQRLLALRRFCAPEGGDFEPLKLEHLSEREDLNGLTYIDLQADEKYREDLSAFENASIRTIVIRKWEQESYLYEVFLRINTGSVKLSPQELRQALHPGPFSRFIDNQSAESPELLFALNRTKPDFRMRDAEVLLRFLAYKFFPEHFAGNLKEFLDNTTKRLNEDWGKTEGRLKELSYEMEEALKFTREIFGDDDYLRKWNGKSFERSKNRAVLDIMLFYFSEPKHRTLLAPYAADIVAGFKDLCDNNSEFLGAIERTTKSLHSNRIRFGAWAERLSQISGSKISSPNFKD